jgi:hypothetical protein
VSNDFKKFLKLLAISPIILAGAYVIYIPLYIQFVPQWGLGFENDTKFKLTYWGIVLVIMAVAYVSTFKSSNKH